MRGVTRRRAACTGVVAATCASLAAALVAAAPAAAQLPADDDLALMLRYLVEDSVTPGIVLGVLDADGTTRVVGYGSAGPEGRPVGPHTAFEIGSITKTFTTTLLADMVRRGEVALDDPVSGYLPDHLRPLSRAGIAVTLEHLATHTSGLPLMGHRPADIYQPYADLTLEKLYAFVDTVALRDIPGHRYRYSNLGMSLLAHALSRAAGRSFPLLVRERILTPQGMDRTGFALEGAPAGHVARGHDDRGARPVEPRSEASLGAGGLYSTAADLLRYLQAQVGPPETDLERAMRMTQEVRGTTAEGRYALGWHVTDVGRRTVVFHGGGTRGFTATLAFDAERPTGAVLLTNVAQFRDPLALTLLGPDPPPADWTVTAVPTDVLARYTGEYAPTAGGDDDARYFIRLEEAGFLTYQPRGRVRARLYATSDSTFFLLRGPWTFTFRDDGAGAVALRMETDAREPGGAGVVEARKTGDATPSPVAVAGGPWYRPPRGPGVGGAVLLGAIIVGVIVFGPVMARRARRPRYDAFRAGARGG